MKMVLHELAMNGEDAPSRKADKAEHVNRKSSPIRAKDCVHQRMVDGHYNEKGKPTGNVVCRECGAVIPDPVKVLG
jgi:hypothetical protein